MSSKKRGKPDKVRFMNTALANNQGELVIPVLISGTFQSPRFAPDLQSVAQMKLKGLVPDFNNPGAFSGALGNLFGQKQGTAPQAGQQQQPSTQDAVQNILGDLPLQYAFKSGPTDLFAGLQEAVQQQRIVRTLDQHARGPVSEQRHAGAGVLSAVS